MKYKVGDYIKIHHSGNQDWEFEIRKILYIDDDVVKTEMIYRINRYRRWQLGMPKTRYEEVAISIHGGYFKEPSVDIYGRPTKGFRVKKISLDEVRAELL